MKATAAILSGNSIQQNMTMEYQELPFMSQMKQVLKFNYPLILLREKLQQPKLITNDDDRQIYYAVAIQNKQLDKLQYACFNEKQIKSKELDKEPRIKVAYQLQSVFNQLLQNSTPNIQQLTELINVLIEKYEQNGQDKEMRYQQEYRLHREHILGLIANLLEFYAMHFPQNLNDIKNINKYIEEIQNIKPRLYYLLKFLQQTKEEQWTIDNIKQYLEEQSKDNQEIEEFLHPKDIELSQELLEQKEYSEEQKKLLQTKYPILNLVMNQTHENYLNFLEQVRPCNHLWPSQLFLLLQVELKQDIKVLLNKNEQKIFQLFEALTQQTSLYSSQYYHEDQNYNIINAILYANAILSEQITSCLLNLQPTINESYNMFLAEQFIDLRMMLASNEAKFLSSWISLKNIVSTLDINKDNSKEYKLKLFEQLISLNGSQQILTINSSLFDSSAIYDQQISDKKEIQLYQETNQKVKQCKVIQPIQINRNKLFDYIYEYNNDYKQNNTNMDLLSFQLFSIVKYMQMQIKGEDTQCIKEYVKQISKEQNQTCQIINLIIENDEKKIKQFISQMNNNTIGNYLIDYMLLTTYSLLFDKKELYDMLQNKMN